MEVHQAVMPPQPERTTSRPRPLTCVGCGKRLTPATAAQGTCPYCGVPGYVDRAGRHFLPLERTGGAQGAQYGGEAATCRVCGAPVQNIVCPACGTHQGRPRLPAEAGQRREASAAAPPGPGSPLPMWARIRWIPWIGGLVFAGGLVVWIAARLIPAVVGWWAASGVAAWLGAFTASLRGLPGPDDPEYTYLFATVVFQVALLPVAIYLLARLIRRLFP